MAETIILYESPELDWLGPPVATRPIWDLQLGPFTPAALLRRALPGSVIVTWSRDFLKGLAPRDEETLRKAEEVILLDARLLPVNDKLAEALSDLKRGENLVAEGTSFARRMASMDALDFLTSLDAQLSVPKPAAQPLKTPFGILLRFWWEMPSVAAGLLVTRWNDSLEITGAKRVGDGELYLSPGAKIQPDVAIAAGPVLLGEGAEVEAQAYIGGPCYLGPGTRVRPQARLLHGVIAGPECRLGGEIEESLFLGYANKQHDGFLGHAVIGEWVNLGAGTNNSDLKNNYSRVRTRYRGRDFDTHQQFVGCCLGDHSKVAIGSRLNTGSVIGAFCNWFGSGFSPRELADFSWVGDEGVEAHDPGKALDTARVVMGRRNRDLPPDLETLYRSLAS